MLTQHNLVLGLDFVTCTHSRCTPISLDSRIASFARIFGVMNRESNENGNKNAKEQSRCFVCDAEVLGRFYALATCRTQSSRTRVIEKLGELVGEGYMVVISEDDVICRSCGILVNTLDRLETEMRQARDYILRFLEKKYSLADGELRGNDDKPKPCQPPQITRSEAKETSDSNSGNKKILTKTQTWLQCDKCKYTTHLNSFMMQHLRDHITEKIVTNLRENVSEIHQESKKRNCGKANDLGNKENETDNSDIIINKDETMKLTFLQPTQTISVTQTTPPPLISFSNYDHPYASNALSGIPTNVSMLSREPMYVLQSIDTTDIDNSRKATRSNSSSMEIESMDKSEDKKQITLKEEGSLEVMEVPWSEMEVSNIESMIVFE